MAKKKTKAAAAKETKTDNVVDPVVTSADDQNGEKGNDQNNGQTSTPHYIGPNYKVNIIMYPNDPIDPRNMTDDEIEATKKKYPNTSEWWAKN